MKYIVLFLIALLGCSRAQPESSTELIPIPELDIQGHRGARGLLPENTVPSFIKALEWGVNTLELDLVVSKDSQLVVSHEPWFHHHISSHPDGRPVSADEAMSLNMFEMTYDEIRAFDVGRRGHVNFPDQIPVEVYKPALSEVVAAVEAWLHQNEKPPVWYNIETKSLPEYYDTYTPQPDVFARLLLSEINRLGIRNRAVVQSFDVNTLIELRKLDARIPQALLVYNLDSLEANLDQLGYVPEIYSPYYRLVDENLIADAAAKGMRVIPWTINSTEEMQRLIDLGVDGIITDYPNRVPGARK